ncbi:hypothetical protein LINPERHAP2_LOCUS39452 [Linum perenne]
MASFSSTSTGLHALQPVKLLKRTYSLHPTHYVSLISTNNLSSTTKTWERKTQYPLQLRNTNMNMSAHCTAGGLPIPPFPSLPDPNSSPGSWKLLLVGLAMAVLVPFWRKRLWSDVKERFDDVVNTVEKVAEVVENVAEQIEKVADEMGNNMNIPAGKLKDAFEFIEDVADKTEKGAQLTGDVIDKVQELEEKVDAYIETTRDNDRLYEEHSRAKELKTKIEETKSKIDKD